MVYGIDTVSPTAIVLVGIPIVYIGMLAVGPMEEWPPYLGLLLW